MRPRRSAKVVSVSSCLGASLPDRLAAVALAVSQAFRTWNMNGSMSGASRAEQKLFTSNLRASAYLMALSMTASRLRNERANCRMKRWVLTSNLLGARWGSARPAPYSRQDASGRGEMIEVDRRAAGNPPPRGTVTETEDLMS